MKERIKFILKSKFFFKRDLKPQNILVTKQGVIKIADFGLARIYGFTMALTSVVVTLWYRSPEVLLHSTYSSTVDIWSLGCIFAELYMRRALFIGQSDIDQLYKIFDILGLPNEQDWPVNSVIPLKSFANHINVPNNKQDSLKKIIPNIDQAGLDLLLKLLDFNMTNRISARDALEHEYFNSKENQQSSLDLNEVKNESSIKSTSNAGLASLPDITNLFQPNILKRKRANNNNNNKSTS